MKMMQLRSIRAKLITVSILLLIIPITVLGIFSYQKSANSLSELGETNLKNSVALTIELIEALNAEVEEGHLTLEEAQEKVKQAILGEQSSDGTRPINSNINLGENGYMFILDDEGTQITHPFTEGSNTWDSVDPNGVKSTQKHINTANDGGGFVYFHWPLNNDDNNIQPKVSYTEKDPVWGWNVVAGTYMMDFNQPANDLLNNILIIAGITLIIGIAVTWLFANNIATPINRISKQMKELANGDLTTNKTSVKSNDEVGKLADSMNHMQKQLHVLIANVATASEKMSNQSEELTQSSSEVKTSSEQIAMTMEELATGSEKQADSASGLSSEMQNFAKKLAEANQQSREIQAHSENVLTLTNEGNELMHASKQQMEKIDQIVHKAVEKVEGLDTQTKEISKLVYVVKDIAAQTNLLALNAAIEAARADEHGKGFAVVADEVRKLAEQVTDSVDNISKIVANVQNESSTVASSLLDGYHEVEAGTNQMEATDEKFKRINQSVTEMVTNINQVANNLNSITNSSQQFNRSIEDIAAISEQSAAGVEETAASSQQTSSSMEVVAQSSNELSRIAEELDGYVNKFKLTNK
ncbi:methyl-accepting chemotaxis protein [Gracilibacillus phocaeensis]|uniref:methyl-accepting chemotaxis protein n=1 Tax=Gracilibacillus phocaeensis TaxID=2042304 RepID=UPI001031A940|nr:cache domain-containing protein [Gracilibacillus phocaeensis]